MNYGSIKKYVRTQLHRADLGADLFDEWQEVITPRIIRDLQYKEGVTELPLTISSFPYTLPDTVDEVLEIYVNVDGNDRKLRAISREQFRLYSNAGSNKPLYYRLNGKELDVTPGGGGFTYNIVFRTAIVPMVNGTDENQVAEYHPEIMIYAFMREAYWYLRDFDGAQAAQETYNSEVAEIKRRDAFIQTGDAPEQSGASAWV